VVAATRGETYQYVVDKYWAVRAQQDDGRLLLVTRTGKEHLVGANDPQLRPAKWWERWLLADKFPSAGETKDA
jgi:hypothetical protein